MGGRVRANTSKKIKIEEKRKNDNNIGVSTRRDGDDLDPLTQRPETDDCSNDII